MSDVVITTALIGGVFAPRLITADMVGRMPAGSVLVDLAADGGGNCELSRPGETITAGGVRIIAPLEGDARPEEAEGQMLDFARAFLPELAKALPD